MIISDSFD